MIEQHTLLEESAKLSGNARETSRIAALRITPRSGSTRRRVLFFIVEQGVTGATDDEIASALRLSPNTARPRRVELLEGFWVADSHNRRDSFYGNPATVWVATEKAKLLVAESNGR